MFGWIENRLFFRTSYSKQAIQYLVGLEQETKFVFSQKVEKSYSNKTKCQFCYSNYYKITTNILYEDCDKKIM